ncbi:HEAT repeat domain-containing protein [Flavihumibacter stibioxidans]|uniref:HEAT repeat domain-containing protein n=1 Tax=Flavihumibacter stibioxidans TaxID=1834163 RepID=A0ABR7M459_9BACT|nr:HEAT repeat domain-containing protein [Flavihumibacter stibioxidans]MBC6489441.1 hypothetical protein [Flavihumibacter stibioxidans]
MKKSAIISILFLYCLAGFTQQGKITIIDLYGKGNDLPDSSILNLLPFREGNLVEPENIDKTRIIEKLKSIPGVKDGHISFVCCNEKEGWTAFVGITRETVAHNSYLQAPDLDVLLPDEIVDNYNRFMDTLFEAIRKGQVEEDRSEGHAMMRYEPARQLQQIFLQHAEQFRPVLRYVLHNSGNASHRAIAAQVLGYASNKNEITNDLICAIEDSDEIVRNNATRALAIIAAYAKQDPDTKIIIPAGPFIKMLSALPWTDRNKGMAILLALTSDLDQAILNEMKHESFTSLKEMSNWKTEGHAIMAYTLLGRTAGYPDKIIEGAFYSANRAEFRENCIRQLKQASR